MKAAEGFDSSSITVSFRHAEALLLPRHSSLLPPTLILLHADRKNISSGTVQAPVLYLLSETAHLGNLYDQAGSMYTNLLTQVLEFLPFRQKVKQALRFPGA
jgi:hypothetical protein